MDKPDGASDEQVLFMTTCMETWIVADRITLKACYGHKLQENALPPLESLENRSRNEVHEKLVHATRNCSNAYRKGRRSFEVLELLSPDTLKSLPSFARAFGSSRIGSETPPYFSGRSYPPMRRTQIFRNFSPPL